MAAMKVAVLIPAAGSSSRFGSKTKKQFSEIDGRAVFLRTIEQFSDRDDIAQIVMAIPEADEEIFTIRWSAKVTFYGVKVILGGAQRYETVQKLLGTVKDEAQLISLHDAVRPCVTKKQIDAVFAAAAKTGAAILAHRLVGTIKHVDDKTKRIIGTVDRSALWEAQTPQVFKRDVIFKAYEQIDKVKEQITDDAQLVEATGHPVTIVESDTSNIKITSPTDLAIAEAIIKSRPKPKGSGPAGPWAAEQGW
jgi:2-C-methyl-D-erythritol 4-phosphate cytidylyltransferase